MTQPQGPSFQITGNDVTWQGWHFSIGYTAREGLVLHRIGYDDGGGVRPIIYRLALDDIYVPYALPDANWVWRTAFDIGEYNIAQYANALQKNVDVPENAVFLDETYASDTGSAGGVVRAAARGRDLRARRGLAVGPDRSGLLRARRSPRARARRHVELLDRQLHLCDVDYIFRLDGGHRCPGRS